MKIPAPMISRAAYPELTLISWWIVVDEIDEEMAYLIYKRNWWYLYQDHLTESEKHLIRRLCDEYGEGEQLLG